MRQNIRKRHGKCANHRVQEAQGSYGYCYNIVSKGPKQVLFNSDERVFTYLQKFNYGVQISI